MRNSILILLIFCLSFFSALAEEENFNSNNTFLATSHSLFNVDIAQLKLNASTQIATSVSSRTTIVFANNLPTPAYEFEPRFLERLKNSSSLTPNYFPPLQFFEILTV